MRTPSVTLLLPGVCVLALAAAWTWSRSQAQRLEAREAAAMATASDASQLLALRGRRERASLNERPRQDLIARVNTTMSATGISARALSGVTTDADGPLLTAANRGEVPSLRSQAMRVAFKAIEPRQLGLFLEHWRSNQALWTPTAIELTRFPSKDPAQERFDASLVLSVIYVAPSTESRSREDSQQ
jgi:hypothetical protein